MAGIRWPPEDSDLLPPRVPASATDLISDDDRSVAADSWSIKSEYGSTLDDEQRHVDASEVLSSGAFRASSDYSSDKEEEPDVCEEETSVLGLQSYWDATYAGDLANFHEHGHAGEVWFGVEVVESVVTWTKNLCINNSQGRTLDSDVTLQCESDDMVGKDLSSWSVLDVGTGNGLLLHELAKLGFSHLTGTDYSEGAIDLARNLAVRDGLTSITFLVDDILETKLERQFRLVIDKGTFDAIGLHPDGSIRRLMYWDSVSKLVVPGGILVVTSCNNTKDELVQEVDNYNQRRQDSGVEPVFRYLDHIRTYPTIMFAGTEGSRVSTVAFLRD
ncbi:hypothetical protein QJS10_CPB12g00309 [Acorus calamus]|uniref:Protein-lysine N-methyltransferase QJS10_CPB12g00309 n=1 Tax=Acorus calamus TaxID=4465 RepID=A0AAV9DM93_ACOCL|nr:hypothetical protein QJS10_CPB12g00309 [Acorus calamus]